MKKHALFTTTLLLSAVMSFGAGFQVNVQGLRQIAMAGTSTGWMWDASSIFYNPGGLARLKGVQAYGSVQFLMVNTEYAQTPTGTYTARSQAKVYTPFNVYVGGLIKKDSKLAVGLGIYTPFGSGISWDDNWAGKFVLTSANLSTIFFQPTVSYRINDMISVGGGFVYATGNVDFKQDLPIQDANGNYATGHLKGSANGVGYNLGIHVKATDNLQIGIDYRSQVGMKVKKGDATFTVPSALSSSFPNTTFTTDVNLPQAFSVGLGYKVTDNLILTAQADYVGWSSYDTLTFQYATHTSTLQDSKNPRDYKNTLALRLGGHYQANKKLAVLAGLAYDPSPVADGLVSPDLPDADRYVASCGFTYKVNKLTILTAFEYTSSKKRDASYTPQNFNGKYQTKAFVPCIGITYDF